MMIFVYLAAAVLTVLFALMAVCFRDLFVSAIFLGASSFFLAFTFFTLHAPDIAITEAAVGAAVSTFLLVMAVSKTEREE